MSTCPICYNHLGVFYFKCQCNCNAKYHINCIQSWLKQCPVCPLCRQYQKQEYINKRIRVQNRIYEVLILLSSVFIICIAYIINILFL